MTLQRVLASVVLCLMAAAASVRGDAAKPEGFAAHFHRDDSTVLVLEDPLPHLRSFLNSPRLRKVMTEGAFGKLLANGGEALDPAAAWLRVNDNRRWIPQQLAVGVSDAGVSDFDHLLRFIALFELQQAAASGDDDDPKVRDEHKVLRQQVADVIPNLRIPRMRVYARFREPEDANALLEMVRLFVQDLPKEELPPGVTFQHAAASLTARFVLDDLLQAEQIDLEDLLTGMGIIDADDAPAEKKKAVDAIRAFKAEVTLEQVGTGLLLTLGPTTSGGPAGLPADFLNLPDAVGRPDKQTILWGRWSATRLKSAAAAWFTLHERWRPSISHKLAGEEPLATEPLLDTLNDVAVRVRKFADNGSLHLWADEKSPAIRLAMQEDPKAPAADLAGSPLARLLPADVDGFSVESDVSLGEIVSDWLLQAEDRMATRSLRADFAGDADAPSVRLEEAYYEHFSAMRELVHRTGLQRFSPGYAMLFGTRGTVSRFEASFEMKAMSRRLSGRDLPTPEMALIGKPRIGAIAMREHIEQVYGSLLRGVRSASRVEALADRPIPQVDARAVAVDHGLGVPTWTFDADTLARASGEAKLRIDVVGDLRPHFFFLDGHVVLSTSPRLSKQIVAAQSGKGKRLMLPEGDDDLIAIGRYTGTETSTIVRQFKGWYLALAEKADAEPDAFAAIFDAVSDFARTIDKMEWTTTQPANERRQVTEGVLIFKAEGE